MFKPKKTLSGIVASLEKLRLELQDHATSKHEEADKLTRDAADLQIKASLARDEGIQAGKIQNNIGALIEKN